MYKLSDFSNIDKKSNYSLPIDIKRKIQLLCKQIGAEPSFTILVQEKTTVQDCICEMNKLTNENKHVQIPIILEILDSRVDEFILPFFNMVHKNVFSSKVYAELFKRFKWPVFHTALADHYETYLKSFDDIQIVDPSDYDAYCEMKLVHDQRRTFTHFIVNLHIQSYYDRTVQTVFLKINEQLDKDKDIMNELVEILFILNPTDIESMSTIKTLSTLKPSDHIGLNYKILFRFMDMLK
jgi:Ni,Fe-hydrogenase maturation factor